MGPALALTSALLALAAQDGTGEGRRQDPPPLRPIAGLHAFESVSTLIYSDLPDRPHRLRASYAFPERVRWWLGAQDEKGLDRHLKYRLGARVFEVLPGGSQTVQAVDSYRARMLLQLEQRRALMLWPDGFEWKGERRERTADLGHLGCLVAGLTGDAGAVPEELWSLDPEGIEVDRFRKIEWRKIDDRSWPAKLEMWHAGRRIWSETVDSIDTRIRFVDSYFLPPDRREDPGRQVPPSLVRRLDVPEACALREPLPKECDWKTAISLEATLRKRWSQRLEEAELRLDPMATIEVSADGAPTACLVRLASMPAHPPEGFSLIPARAAMMTVVEGAQSVDRVVLDRTRREVPAGVEPGAPYVRFDPSKPGEQVLLFVPFVVRK